LSGKDISENTNTSNKEAKEEDVSPDADDELDSEPAQLRKVVPLTAPIVRSKLKDQLNLVQLKNELQALSVPNLKDKCREKNLKVGGRKDELVDRLLDKAEEDSRLPDIRDYTAARQAAESNSFASKFLGNISDFSEAERIGFGF